MAIRTVTERGRGRGLLLAALAALGILAGAAAEGHAQDAFRQGVYGRGAYGEVDGYGAQRTAYLQNGRRGQGGYSGYGYGPPPPGYGGQAYGAGGGYRRGQVLPQDQRGRAVDDPGRYHLRAAPNGYGWVGDGRNAYLMQRSTGMVLDSVPGAYESGPRNGGGGGRGYQGGGRGYEGGGGRVQEGRGGGGGRGREQDGGRGRR